MMLIEMGQLKKVAYDWKITTKVKCQKITFVLVDVEGPGPICPIACCIEPCLWISVCNSGAYIQKCQISQLLADKKWALCSWKPQITVFAYNLDSKKWL